MAVKVSVSTSVVTITLSAVALATHCALGAGKPSSAPSTIGTPQN
jgi:hypothetical protein